jgi:phytoene/squalene synthetase
LNSVCPGNFGHVLRRLSLTIRGLAARRAKPDLAALSAETDPERFLWAVLPHAARSFSASIVVLPQAESRVAAVAYLYARMLDTYEDLLPDELARPGALRMFAARLTAQPRPAAEQISPELAVDDRDRLHVLLAEKAGLIDDIYDTLEGDQQKAIARLIESMADGMAWGSERFNDQGGVLIDDEQLLRYCNIVIGHPAEFVLSLLVETGAQTTEDTFAVSEMIQLANVTRDIERDLARQIGYDPSLRPHLGTSAEQPIRAVRERLTRLGLQRAPAFERLYVGSGLQNRPSMRLAAVLMLLFTDLHYRAMTTHVGGTPWQGPNGKVTTLMMALPAAVSHRYAARTVRRVTARMYSGGTASPTHANTHLIP